MFQTLTRRVLEPPAVGLDISDLTLKFCRVSRSGDGLALDYFGEIDIPPGIVVGGEIKKEDELVAILGEGLLTADGERVRDRYCIASLPEEKSFVRLLELPALKPEDIGHAVRWEVEGVIPLPFADILFDYEVVPGPPRAAAALNAQPAVARREVLITAFPRNIVESYHAVLRRAGFLPLALELESQAISRAIVSRVSPSRPTIIVDVGTTRTSFIIFAGGSMVFTKSTSVGGRDFEAAIAAQLGLPLARAREVKIEAGLNKNYQGGKVMLALEPHLKVLTSELEEQLSFYQRHPVRNGEERREIQQVILCGGDANLIGLAKYVSTAIRRLVLLGDPFVNFRFGPGIVPPIPKNKSLKYTTAIGLALRAAGL